MIKNLVQLRAMPETERDGDWHMMFDEASRAIGDHFGEEGAE